VVLPYAGTQRGYVEEVAGALKGRGARRARDRLVWQLPGTAGSAGSADGRVAGGALAALLAAGWCSLAGGAFSPAIRLLRRRR
jgi:hypothetical protein